MRILMILEREFPPDNRVEKEAVSLINAGHEVHLASLSFSRKYDKTISINGIRIHKKYISPFTFKSSIGALDFPFYFNFWKNYLLKLFSENKFDVLHIHDLPLAQVGFDIRNRFRVPVVLDLHENYPSLLEESVHTTTFPGNLFFSSKKWRKYEVYAANRADRIITVIQEMKQRLIRLGIDKKKIFVVENTPLLNTLPTNDYDSPTGTRIRLVYTGGINIHRGLQVIIKGLPEVIKHYPDLVLEIYGHGKYTSTLQNLAVRYKTENNVIFHGPFDQKDVYRIIARSHIALIPHLKSEQSDNSSPNKLYQYLSTGKYIIASNCDSISRILQESKCGITYRHDSPGDFAKTLLTTLNHKKHLTLCESGRSIIMKKYNWETSSMSLIQLYQNLE